MLLFKEKKYSIVFLILVLFCSEMIGQSRNIIGTHKTTKTKVVKKERDRIEDPTETLAKSITAHSSSDSEKVYAIYRWIAANIRYDTELRLSKKLQKKIYTSEENVVDNVLDRKMALCGGYAFLFRDLCEHVNIPVKVVHGFTKPIEGQPQNYKQPNHTWNAVKLNGEWQLLDITWAISHGSENKPDNFWFLTRPQDFIYSHYPENEIWTLLRNPISLSEFKKSIHR